ncbi:MAG TPA: TolC family protein [Flavobacteriales bacterium]|nr:TolC family protein [Flavobacteriales bacterium]
MNNKTSIISVLNPAKKIAGILKLGLLMFGLLFLQPAVAQQKIDLQTAVKMAVANNPLVKANKSKVKQAQAKTEQVKTSFLPQLNALSKYFYTNNTPNFYPLLGKQVPVMNNNTPTGDYIIMHPMAPYPDLDRDIMTNDLNLIYPIYTGHKRESALKMTQKLQEAYKNNVQESEADVGYQVKSLFYNYLMLNAVIDVYQDVLKQLNAHMNLAKEAYKQGVRSEFDIINFESKIEEFKTKIIEFEGKRDVVKTAMERLIGIPDGQEVDFVGDINKLYQKDLMTQMASTEDLVANNSKIKFLNGMQSVLDEKINMTKAADLPVLFAFGNYHIYHGMDFPPFDKTWRNGYAVGVGLKMNLFNGNKSRYQIDETRAKQEELEQYKDGLRLKLHIEHEKVKEQIKSLEAQKKSMETHLKVAQKAYEIAQTAYKNGVITNIELNDVQLRLAKVRIGILKTEKEILAQKAYLKMLEGQIE